MTKYCKKCGTELIFEYGNTHVPCPTCNKLVAGTESISKHTMESRINQLKAMDDLMCEANDEYIYITWINYMPDCPSDDDFFWIALDDEGYNECFDAFVRLIAKDGNRY